jgi:hypothetical protein
MFYSAFLHRLFHETFQTHLVVEPDVPEDSSELVFQFRGFRGDYTVSVLDMDKGTITTLPELYTIE